MGIYFRGRRIYEIGLIAIRDVSPLLCAAGAGRFDTSPLRYTPFRGHDCRGRLATSSERMVCGVQCNALI